MKSISRQLTLWLLGGLALLLALAGFGVQKLSQFILVSEFDATLRARALALCSMVEQENGTVRMEFPADAMSEFKRHRHPDYYQIRLGNGSTLKRSSSLAEGDLPAQLGSMKKPALWNARLPDGRPGRLIGIRFFPQIEGDDETKSTPRLESSLVLATDCGALNKTLSKLQSVLMVTGFIVLTGSALLIRGVVKKSLAPLAEVADQSTRIDATTLDRKFRTDAMPRELQPICVRLNDLLARLQSAFERERRFTADVAHELRTPVAELRSLAEVTLKWQSPDAEAAQMARDALAIAMQMEGIVVGLLALARCENKNQLASRESVPVIGLMERVWMPFQDKANRKNLALRFEIARNLSLDGDPELLAVILTNLLSNAVEYTPEAGCVQVSASEHAGRVTLTVSNETCDLVEEDIPHLFERFWRKDSARTDSTHSGLGLSIAFEIARIMEGTLIARFEEGMLSVALSVPASTSEKGIPKTQVALLDATV